ncbi:MAG: hypothetical protein U9N06_05530 [candidate division WOR-3 bacterium]|nr:hypothetical protein [candidate division WOR-3 bacterium]
MNPEIPFEDVLEVPGVQGFVLISAEDGSLLKRGGITPGNMDELVGFIASAAEIITESCGLKGIKSIKGVGRENIVIIPYNNAHLGFALERGKKDVEEEILKSLEKAKKSRESKVSKLLKLKAKQLNLLLEEFTRESDPDMWQTYVSQRLSGFSKGSKFEGLITLKDLELRVSKPKNLTTDEVNKFMKSLLDSIVKKAISEFGKGGARQCVLRVIKKISKKGKE